jgi:hypothetical protein
MAHRHEIGPVLLEVYVALVNSDLTEGRGSVRDKGIWLDPKDAYEDAKGMGVMGMGDGDIALRTFMQCGVKGFVPCGHIIVENRTIYNGNHKKSETGWVPDYDPRKNDPEYQQYLALKKKFESA